MFAVVSCASAAEEEYVLGPGDRIRVAVYGREDLSTVYTISPSGAISMPLVGQFHASGLDVPHAEEQIAAAYAGILTSDGPVAPTISVNIEILQFRPFYVVGDVESAGGYPYQSGLTVLSAIAVAGGRMSARTATKYSSVERSREEEVLAGLIDSYLTDVVREARLVAEQNSLPEIQLPEDVKARVNDSRVNEAVSGEMALFRARARMVEGQVRLLSARLNEYSSEITELSAERESLERKRDMIDKRVAAFRTIVDKGAIARLDLVQFEINAIEAERDLRQNSVMILDAKLGRNLAEQGITNIRTQRTESIASDLVEVRSRLTRNLIRLTKSAERLELMSGAAGGAKPGDEQERYVIRRLDEGSPVEISALPDTPIRPGDTLVVPFPGRAAVATEALQLPQRLPGGKPD
ncbi:MAG: polysaccharide biosynthesis/export family protein [Gammaproteobacteria bacterium]|nr:polysaccharide biosynthesis/export family protein [Gammaproteobacteria bacterium]